MVKPFWRIKHKKIDLVSENLERKNDKNKRFFSSLISRIFIYLFNYVISSFLFCYLEICPRSLISHMIKRRWPEIIWQLKGENYKDSSNRFIGRPKNIAEDIQDTVASTYPFPTWLTYKRTARVAITSTGCPINIRITSAHHGRGDTEVSFVTIFVREKGKGGFQEDFWVVLELSCLPPTYKYAIVMKIMGNSSVKKVGLKI